MDQLILIPRLRNALHIYSLDPLDRANARALLFYLSEAKRLRLQLPVDVRRVLYARLGVVQASEFFYSDYPMG